MTTLATPGVFFERARVARRGLPQRTDVTGFVGMAARGPVHHPQRVLSWREFSDTFGGFLAYSHLAYAVRAFFENGGRVAWVVRIADVEAARAASVTVPATSGADGATTPAAYVVRARSPGTWGNTLAAATLPARRAVAREHPQARVPADRLLVDSVAGFEVGSRVRLTQPGVPGRVTRLVEEVDPLQGMLRFDGLIDEAGLTPGLGSALIAVESVEFTLLILESGRVAERFDALAPDARSSVDAVRAVADRSRLVTLERAGQTSHALPRAPWGGPLEGRLTGGVDGLRGLTVFDAVGTPVGDRYGLAALDRIDEVAILCMPDLTARPAPIDGVRRTVQRPAIDPCDPQLGGMLATVAGIVRAADTGAPLPGVVVRDGRDDPPATDPDGTFALPGQLPDASIDVVFSREGYDEQVLRINVADPSARALVVSLSPQDLPPALATEDIAYAQRAMVSQCEERRDRFCLLDVPLAAGEELQLSDALAWRARFSTAFGALYYPWVTVADPLRPPGFGGQLPGRDIPPCGHIAGVYAATDLRSGVFRPPANQELRWVTDLVDDIGDREQGLLNPAGVNAIRCLHGRGVRVYGARTLAPPDAGPSVFVNVRRLLSALEEAMLDGLQWAVFEPNDDDLRAGVALWLTALLDRLWRLGAFVGDQPEAAYEVRCDRGTTTPEDAANGRLRAEVAVAPTVPYEFVVVRLGITADELQVSEV